MKEVVFDLWYEREYDDRTDTELHIGIYSSEFEAKAAITRLSDKEGFRDYPKGFKVYAIKLNATGWVDGFVTYSESETIAKGGKTWKSDDLRDMPPKMFLD